MQALDRALGNQRRSVSGDEEAEEDTHDKKELIAVITNAGLALEMINLVCACVCVCVCVCARACMRLCGVFVTSWQNLTCGHSLRPRCSRFQPHQSCSNCTCARVAVTPAPVGCFLTLN
jgi:hypothetical protein